MPLAPCHPAFQSTAVSPKMLKDDVPGAILRSARRVGQLSGLPGRAWRGLLCGGQRRGQRLPSPLPLTTSCPSRSGAPAGQRRLRDPPLPSRKIHLGGSGPGRGHRRWQEEGRGGAAPPLSGIRRCSGVRSGLALRLAAAPVPRPGSTRPAGQRGRLRGGGGRTAPSLQRRGQRAPGGGCPHGILGPQARDLLPSRRGLSEEPRDSAREVLFPSPATAPADIPLHFLREKTRQRKGRKKGSREWGES